MPPRKKALLDGGLSWRSFRERCSDTYASELDDALSSAALEPPLRSEIAFAPPQKWAVEDKPKDEKLAKKKGSTAIKRLDRSVKAKEKANAEAKEAVRPTPVCRSPIRPENLRPNARTQWRQLYSVRSSWRTPSRSQSNRGKRNVPQASLR